MNLVTIRASYNTEHARAVGPAENRLLTGKAGSAVSPAFAPGRGVDMDHLMANATATTLDQGRAVGRAANPKNIWGIP